MLAGVQFWDVLSADVIVTMSLFAAERCQVKVKPGPEAIAYCVQGLEHIQAGRVLAQ